MTLKTGGSAMKTLPGITLITVVAFSALTLAQSRQAPMPRMPLEHELKSTTPEPFDAGVRDAGTR
ncbi:MAG: hypothetical protein DI536_09535 [Archangium gephyra]|uniref:Uncharacterized protein n=1 Tax=Archangium gephyra TaxID=48 RepID=A0A2W5V0N9_9BACT|nr:MAG: hypothetical protein DI536_09535 [Archangium gephyra]